MTTHGAGGLSRWWLRSVAARLVRRASAPVLLLHPGDLPQPTEFRRILGDGFAARSEVVVSRATDLIAVGTMAAPAPSA